MSSLKNKINQTTALVESVYIYNSPERKKTISNIWAKYNMLPDNLTQSLGKLYQIDEDLYNPGDIKGLYDYTHDKQSDYSRSITERFLTVGEENTKSDIEDISKEEYKAWYNKAYQGKNYYDELSGYSHSFREKTNITYNDGNTYSGSDNGYSYIDYETENNFESTIITPPSQLTHHYFNKPKKSDYKNNVEAYKAAIDEWVKRKRNVHQEDKGTLDKFVDYLNEENSHIDEPKTILTKTAKLFKENKINSLVSRLYDNDTILEYADTSKSRQGRSRGRNLINRNASYNNPFCRSWAAHHQYGDKSSLIRKNLINGKDVNESELIKKIRTTESKFLSDYSVLKNGFIRITPGVKNVNIKKCMFSIENLAWKDINVNEISTYEQGPNGGRIMWFPPYDLQFQESSQVNWNENNFIGRGEPIYTYTNTRRSGSLSFTLLIDHPSIMNEFNNRSEDEKDNYDEDNDILRFFAGCDIPMKLKTISYEEENITNTPPLSEEAQETQNDESQKICVDIYFPFAYFGTNSYKFDFNGGLGGVFDYLFMGCNNTVSDKYKDDKNSNWMGYEIGERALAKIDTSSKTQLCGINFFHLIDTNSENFNCEDKDLGPGEQIENSITKLNNSCENNNISFSDLYMLLYIEYKGKIHEQQVLEYAKDNGIIASEITFEDINDKNKKIFINEKADEIFKKGGIANYDIEIKYNKNTYKEELREGYANEIRAKNIENAILATQIIGYDNKITKTSYEEKINVNPINSVNNFAAKKERKIRLILTPKTEKTTQEITDVVQTDIKIDEVTIKGSISYSESKYFENIEYIDNFTYQKIKEKIKYFDPAYHSISPEGFNSRLTFLQQCTRQGHTIERKTNDLLNTISTAGNMAFGRPPFCILRIGDFINTKILIRNLNIVYQNGNGMQWDINPEGIGVQPMFAKVTMQIEIIGGQSLDAPITRLNNAVSFNYYANTGVYDNRADIAIYNNEGSIEYKKMYIPTINNPTDTNFTY